MTGQEIFWGTGKRMWILRCSWIMGQTFIVFSRQWKILWKYPAVISWFMWVENPTSGLRMHWNRLRIKIWRRLIWWKSLAIRLRKKKQLRVCRTVNTNMVMRTSMPMRVRMRRNMTSMSGLPCEMLLWSVTRLQKRLRRWILRIKKSIRQMLRTTKQNFLHWIRNIRKR